MSLTLTAEWKNLIIKKNKRYDLFSKKNVPLQIKTKNKMATITLTTNNQTKLDLLIALAKELRVKCAMITGKRKNEVELADEDIRNGKVYKAESVDDMFNQILGEGNW